MRKTREGGEPFLDFELRKYGGIVIFTGNLNKKKDTSTIKISDPFFFRGFFFYKEWHTKGVTKVQHLMDKYDNFLSLPAFEINMY